jgi:3-dehydroquinate synthase
MMVIGGGAVLDMGGFAAATAHRGIRLIRVPTTVLAQNDSGVGVKNGINAFGAKNFVGTFAPPYAVINDREFLRTLDDRDWRSGIAEAIKVALIKDRAFFESLAIDAERLAPPTRDPDAIERLVHRCAELHLEHIATGGDPFELGSSRPLDFGHWAAHRLEHLTAYRLRHGEAVAIGIALDTTYSWLLGLLSEAEWVRIMSLFDHLGFMLFVPELEAHLDHPTHDRSLFRGLREFQEHLGGRLTIMLLRGIGRPIEVHEIDQEVYRKAIQHLRERSWVREQVNP